MINYKREIILLLTVLFTTAVLGETRIKIAVVDTGIQTTAVSKPFLCTEGNIDFTGTGLYDNEGHGTNVAGLLASKIDVNKHCLLIIKYYDTTEKPFGKKDITTTMNAVWDYLLKSDAKYVNMSFTGETYISKEYRTLARLSARGVKIAVAAGNDAKNLDQGCFVYPACYKIDKNFYVVTASDIPSFANVGGTVNASAPGLSQRGKFGPMLSGTSQAASNFLGSLIKSETK